MSERSSLWMLPLITVILVALYPVIDLAATNADEVSRRYVTRSMVASVVVAIVLLLLLRLIVRDWGKAALIDSAALLLFFSYGHVYSLVAGNTVGGFIIGGHRSLLFVWTLILVTWAWIVLRVLNKIPRWIGTLTMVTLVAITFTLFSLASREVETRRANVNFATPGFILEGIPNSVRRDIYYIVVDGYGRLDVLSRIYDFDNTDFIEFLRNEGFYVAEESRSNYIQTALSLASSMNLNYINDLSAVLGEDSTNVGPLKARIQNNFAMSFLERNGYRLMAFNTGLVATSIEDVDVYLPSENNPFILSSLPETWSLYPFESFLLETTAAPALLNLLTQSHGSYIESIADPLYEVHRARINSTIQAISKVPEMPGVFFVFAHVVAPHPPFVFGPNGESVNPDRPYGLFDGSDFISHGGTIEEYIAGYRDEVVHLNTLLERAIAEIIATSDPLPIIILQADHGPASHLIWDSPSLSDIEERISILNAYYLPDGGKDLLYPSISPVNSFRLVFSQYFGGDFPLLEDRAYFSSWVQPYRFVLLE